jgi:hypothetical protein
MYGRTEDETVGGFYHGDKIIDTVIDGAFPVFEAAAASQATRNRAFAYVKYLRFDSVFVERARDFAERRMGAAFFIRASVDQ